MFFLEMSHQKSAFPMKLARIHERPVSTFDADRSIF